MKIVSNEINVIGNNKYMTVTDEFNQEVGEKIESICIKMSKSI